MTLERIRESDIDKIMERIGYEKRDALAGIVRYDHRDGGALSLVLFDFRLGPLTYRSQIK